MRLINVEDIEHFAFGAAVLGSGGGGDPRVGKLLAREAIRQGGPVKLIGLNELADDALVVSAAMVGSPTALAEKLPSGDEIVLAFESIQDHLNRKIDAAVSAEGGGLNGIIPLAAGARLGIPVVDADAMGRAYPEIQMVTCTLHGIPATPMSMADEKGNTVLLKTLNNRWTERLARSLVVDMGAAALAAFYPMSGRQAKTALVPGTLSLIESIGRAIGEARAQSRNPIDAVRRVTRGVELFRGKVADVERRTATGFARGEATLQGMGAYESSVMRIQFQNENLVAWRDGQLAVSTPDLIVVLDADTAQPIPSEALRYGFRVVVLGIPCVPAWRTPEGLALVGPRYFGYDADYQPLGGTIDD